MPKVIDFSSPEWKEYEDLVCDAICEENPELIVERNVMLNGRNSGTRRQIDILLRSEIAGHEVIAVVDCKHYSRKLDVNDIGSFKSLIEDVNADMGILVTQSGFSKSAETLAKQSRVRLELRTLEELREYKISFDYCDVCDPGEDHFPGVIDWGTYPELTVNDENKVIIGNCDWCNSLHVRCLKCDAVTAIPDVLFDEQVECEGGCGTSFFVKSMYIGHGMLEYELNVIDES